MNSPAPRLVCTSCNSFRLDLGRTPCQIREFGSRAGPIRYTYNLVDAIFSEHSVDPRQILPGVEFRTARNIFTFLNRT